MRPPLSFRHLRIASTSRLIARVRLLLQAPTSSYPLSSSNYQSHRSVGFSGSALQMAPNEVDKTIHPHATGAALETANKHEAEKSLKLYAGWFCPFVQRTWITLNEKNIDYQYIEINPYHKDPDFLKLNPRGELLCEPYARPALGTDTDLLTSTKAWSLPWQCRFPHPHLKVTPTRRQMAHHQHPHRPNSET